MNQDRKLTFGKYKGKEIKYIILSHIGYIMWCFENLGWFKLTDEEQALCDAIAIMIKKERLQMTFPVGQMYSHIKDREALERLETPFASIGKYTSCTEKDNPIYKSVEKYRIRITRKASPQECLTSLAHCMNKEIERAQFNGESDDDIFGGWGHL